ncbi:glycosyltransferase [Campylobacter ureolyticus]|uniref:Glycosyltransferase EpsH n=1 Tax=Campylobacter ureolyticus TaxID=827 RepID=A0A6N2RIL0_9BACT
MQNNPLISIVVPVYNVEKYLKKCIQSIVDQTYKNLEIILVDDGSSDNSGKICDEFAQKDNRIKVIHKINGGQADARNKALDIMNGEWVSFVDSDDFVSPYYIENLHYLISKYDVDIAITSFVRFYNENTKLSSSKISNQEVLLHNPDEAVKNMLYGKYYSVSPWSKIYKKDLFYNNRFTKGKIYEDFELMPIITSQSKKVAFCDVIDYFYYCRQNSTTKSDFSQKNMQGYEALDSLDRYFSNNLSIKNVLKDIRALSPLTDLPKIKISSDNERVLFDEVSKNINHKRLFILLFSKNINLKLKIKIIFFICFGRHTYAKFERMRLKKRINKIINNEKSGVVYE